MSWTRTFCEEETERRSWPESHIYPAYDRRNLLCTRVEKMCWHVLGRVLGVRHFELIVLRGVVILLQPNFQRMLSNIVPSGSTKMCVPYFPPHDTTTAVLQPPALNTTKLHLLSEKKNCTRTHQMWVLLSNKMCPQGATRMTSC